MNTSPSPWMRGAAFFIVALLVAALLAQAVFYPTQVILVNRFGIDNAFTRFVSRWSFLGTDFHSSAPLEAMRSRDWSVDYPPLAEDMPATPPSLSLDARWQAFADGLYDATTGRAVEMLTRYNDYSLPGHYRLQMGRSYWDRLLHWTVSDGSGRESIAQLMDGYLIRWTNACDMTDGIAAIRALNDLITACGTPFLYVQAPNKLCRDDPADALDHANDNCDRLLAGLAEAGVATLDLRTALHADGLDHHAAFYRTDHHWTIETGRWAASILVDALNPQLSGKLDGAPLASDQFQTITYEGRMFGSLARRLTSVRETPEDFTTLEPLNDVALSVSIPECDFTRTGGLACLYDSEIIETSDVYMTTPYSAYLYGLPTLVQITRTDEAPSARVLVIGDSFKNAVAPFLALSAGQIDVLDFRYFNGHWQSYLATHRYDAVVLLYSTLEPSKLAMLATQL